jgi:phosphoribosyl 1,2-cyclic phosphodiesterase
VAIQIRFWGVRGSIPCPGAEYAKYGGNTACIELRFGQNKKLMIVDAGSGIRTLGNDLLKTDLPKGPIKTEIFFTHTHWDHIMGFPFFTPIYVPKTELTIYGPVTYEDDTLDKIIGGQLRYRYFPVRQSELAANIKYIPLKESTISLGDGITVKTKYLNHPILCLGYRFEYGGKVFCTVFDTEPFRNVFTGDPSSPDYDKEAFLEGEIAAKEENEKIMRFIYGADVCVYDTQYTYKEYMAGKIGWGHTSFEDAINTAHKANVKKLLFFHHDILRKDTELDEILIKYRKRIQKKTNLEIDVAHEGMTIDL